MYPCRAGGTPLHPHGGTSPQLPMSVLPLTPMSVQPLPPMIVLPLTLMIVLPLTPMMVLPLTPMAVIPTRALPHPHGGTRTREFFVDSLLVRIHLIIVMIFRTPAVRYGILNSLFQVALYLPVQHGGTTHHPHGGAPHQPCTLQPNPCQISVCIS